ncbi:MAG: Rrf2 family transcriptional regulator [Rhodospirillales bacterium]|nr:Rrf2 family transcriptional regulator [Rhodospirillales bacterium]
MKLQKATRCALFAVLELASDPQRQLSATEIADKYSLSSNHLAKVLRDLGRAGLVESVRGAGGGYRFSGNAKRATLFDVIKIFEDIDADCLINPEPGDDTDIGQALCMAMQEIDSIARGTLMSITIQTLLKSIHWNRERLPQAETETP